MTYLDFGRRLRSTFPKLNRIPLDDEALAQYFLNLYPEYYDYISPAAKRLKEIADRVPHSSRWTETGRLESISAQVQINKDETEAVLLADASIRASAQGVTLHVYEEMKKADHAAHLQGKISWEERRQALEAIRLAVLDEHRNIEQIKTDLRRLHLEEYEIETSSLPVKVKAKDLSLVRTLTRQLRRHLNGRLRRLVSDAAPETVRPLYAPDIPGSDYRSAEEKGSHQVSGPKNRVGF